MKRQLVFLTLLAMGAANGQLIPRETYDIKTIGMAVQSDLPSMGIDAIGRAGGCVEFYDENGPFVRGWIYDAVRGYQLTEATVATVNAVSSTGTIVGSQFGSPTMFDWLGQSTLVMAEMAGTFMAVNRYDAAVGYYFDPMNGMAETAFLRDQSGNLLNLTGSDYMTSAAYGINDTGVIVGCATDLDFVTHPCVWFGQLKYLPEVPGAQNWAIGINNRSDVVGVALLPTDQYWPVVWRLSSDSYNYTLIVLPPGYDNGIPSAINDRGEVVGTMWATGGVESRAFLWTPARGLVDLNDLKGPSSGLQRLLTAGAINENGDIIGIASYNGPRFAYVAHPNRPSRVPGGVIPW